ncbi:MAG TPA: histidine kinase [Planctomycetaceae bacterium]|nr:histidine kinase [Planctomycetaceae bacterium]
MSELKSTFDHFDRDANGVIDFGEFCELLSALGAGMDEESAHVGFEAIDVDSNGQIDFSEFSAWWSEQN